MPDAGYSLDYAFAVAKHAAEDLRRYCDRAQIAGSLRRLRSRVRDIEIVAEPSEVSDGLFGEVRPALQEVRQIAEGMGPIEKGGDRYIQVRDIYGSGITLDLFLVHPPFEWGVQLAIRTGPASYSTEAVSRIKGRLWKCADGWIRDDRGQRVPCPTEEDFFRAARMPFLPPHERGVS